MTACMHPQKLIKILLLVWEVIFVLSCSHASDDGLVIVLAKFDDLYAVATFHGPFTCLCVRTCSKINCIHASCDISQDI